MNASSRQSTASATKMAFATNAAGPMRRSLLKAEPIVQSEIGVISVLAALLVGGVRTDTLPRGNGEFQSSAVRLRSKTAYLIDAREILNSRCKKDVARKLLPFSTDDWECQTRSFRGAPLVAQAWERGLRLSYPYQKRPVARQIDKTHTGEGLNFGVAIPVPVLLISELESANEPRLADFQPTIQLEESFSLGDHATIVRSRSSHGQPSPFWKLGTDAGLKLRGVRRAPLKEVPNKCGAPMRSPLRLKVEPFVIVWIQEIERVIFLADAQFVLGFPEDGSLCDSHFL